MKSDDKLFIYNDFSKMNNFNWDEEREYWEDKLRKMTLPEDMKMPNLYEVQRQLCEVFDEASVYYYYYKSKFENISNKVKTVKRTSMKGKNPEERKANARKKLVNYKVNDKGDTINLIKLKQRWKDRHDFYKQLMKALDKKQSAVSNSIGMAKIDAQIQTGYGAS